MRNLLHIAVAILTSIVLILTNTIATTATTTYTVIDLGVLSSSSSTGFINASDINNNGQVVGSASTTDGNRAFLWDSSTGMQALGVLGIGSDGSSFSSATAINDNGQVVGFSSTTDGDRAFLWDSTNGMQNLGVLDDTTTHRSSQASGINDRGQVVGTSSLTQGYRHAFLWDSTNLMQDLGVLEGPNSNYSAAKDINDLGQVVGSSSSSISSVTLGTNAFLWDSTNGMQDLGVLLTNPSAPPSGTIAESINNHSIVVGGPSSRSINRNDPAFIWDSTNGIRRLEFYGAYYNVAYDINNLGQIVGYVNLRSSSSFAATWDSNTRRIANLNNFIDRNSGWTLTSASAINDKGEIVGYGIHNGQSRAFLLQPTTASIP